MRYTQHYLDDLSLAMTVPGIEKLKGTRVLLTGATGLIGSCVADMLLYLNVYQAYDMDLVLAGRNEMRLHDRFAWWKDSAYKTLPYDATKAFSTNESFDFILHCASNAHPAAYVQQPVETMEANIIGVSSLLQTVAKQGFGRILYVSSSEVYGERSDMELFKEGDSFPIDILSPRSCYPSSKRAAETLCASYKAEYGVDFVCVRPGHVYGPTASDQDSRAHAQFARQAASGETIVMKSAGTQLRSYCYVVDCASAMLTVLVNGASGCSYNISNKNSLVTIKEMAEAFAHAGGVDVSFDMPTAAEAQGYTTMSCSALDATLLENLGWQGVFTMELGAERTLEVLRS